MDRAVPGFASAQSGLRAHSNVAFKAGSPYLNLAPMTRIPSHIPAHVPAQPPADIASLICGLRAGERAALARAITLVESKRPDHQRSAHQLVQSLLPHTGTARRVGITGAPGVGKSTTIDALG